MDKFTRKRDEKLRQVKAANARSFEIYCAVTKMVLDRLDYISTTGMKDYGPVNKEFPMKFSMVDVELRASEEVKRMMRW